MNQFMKGVKAMLPVVPGVLPFGLVMGASAKNIGLGFGQIATMNNVVFAGSSQLASVDLMSRQTTFWIIILTGLVINMRFLLYSATFADLFKKLSLGMKIFGAYLLTDQSYAVTMANIPKLKTEKDQLNFFFGNSICMFLAWNISVLLGVIFGNFAPAQLSLDFAVPLSFMALAIASVRGKKYIAVAIISAGLSVIFYKLPLNLGLLVSTFLGLVYAAWLTRRRV